MDRAAAIIPRAPSNLRFAADLPPIVERELRMAARRGATYWGRVGTVLVPIVLIAWWLAGSAAQVLPPQAGRLIFRLLALAATFILLNRVIRLTAEAFAREKREDTLGLLFLTPLKPIDLVLGKLVSSASTASIVLSPWCQSWRCLWWSVA